jgi:hypothetical protein
VESAHPNVLISTTNTIPSSALTSVNIQPSISPAKTSKRKSPSAPISSSAPPAARNPSPGSCPGGGICNGQGGKVCCQGCPAFNNRVYHGVDRDKKPSSSTILSKSKSESVAPSGVRVDGQGGADDLDGVTAMSCFNCETSESFPRQ